MRQPRQRDAASHWLAQYPISTESLRCQAGAVLPDQAKSAKFGRYAPVGALYNQRELISAVWSPAEAPRDPNKLGLVTAVD